MRKNQYCDSVVCGELDAPWYLVQIKSTVRFTHFSRRKTTEAETMAVRISLFILHFVAILVVNECKLSEFYRWKQINFERLAAGKTKAFVN